MQHCRLYRDIAKRLIRTLPEFEDIRVMAPRIAYLSSSKEKVKNRKTILGECFKVDEKYEWCCNYDFFIVIYEPNVEDFTDKQIEILLRHELHHVGVDFTDNGPEFYVVPHDIEEFWEIINDHGSNWSDKDAEG